MSVVVRFAPSPTGALHLGNAYIALVNWIVAQQNQGQFLLRFDDTDLERSKSEYIESIVSDLKWLGLYWTDCFKQSSHIDYYLEVQLKLIEAQKLYPCYESQAELELQRKLQMQAGRTPIYNRAALWLSDSERKALEAKGHKPYWRFKLDYTNIAWTDLVKGQLKYNTACLSDPVLVRSDGSPLYTLTSVIDDLYYQVTHIIRGEDHITNTAIQIQLLDTIATLVKKDFVMPVWAHLPMLIRPNGQPLSKREASSSIGWVRAMDIEPITIANFLTINSTEGTKLLYPTLEEIVDNFDITKVNRSAVCVNIETVSILNQKVLSLMSFAQVKSQLEAMSIFATERFWKVICCNITKLKDVEKWWKVINGQGQSVQLNSILLAKAAQLLPNNLHNAEQFDTWISNIKAATKTSNKELYYTLRLALTGEERGPSLKDLVLLMPQSVIYKYLTKFN